MKMQKSSPNVRRMFVFAALAALGLLGLILFVPQNAQAENCTWATGATGNWSDSTKWSCGHVPTSTDVAIVNTNAAKVSLTAATTVGGLQMSAGTLQGDYKLTVASSMVWSGGTLLGPGDLAVGSAASLSLNGTLTLDGRTLINNSKTATWGSAGDTHLTFKNGGILNNQVGAKLDIKSDGLLTTLTGTEGIVNNNGIVVKSGGNLFVVGGYNAGTRVAFNNTGSVKVQTGTFDLYGGGASSGPWTITDSPTVSSTLRFQYDYNLNTGSDVSGTGVVEFKKGTVNVASNYNLSGVTRVNGIVNFNSGATVQNIGAELDLSGDIQNGMLSTVVPININGRMAWSGGTYKGTGKLTIASSTTPNLTLSGTMVLDGAAVDNYGWGTATGNAVLNISNSGAWNNQLGSVLDFQGHGIFVGYQGTNGTLTNQGTVKKSSGTDTTTLGGAQYNGGAILTVDNTGLIQALSGELFIKNLVQLPSPATTLTGGQYEVTAELSFPDANIFTNSARVTLDGAAAQITNRTDFSDGLKNLATNSASGSLTISGGKPLAVPGTFANAGQVAIGSGSTFTVPGSANYEQTGGSTEVDGTLDVGGQVNIQGGTLTGVGTIDSSLNNAATVSPGTPVEAGISAGALSVTGNYVQTSAGVLNIELGGTVISENDRLSVTGSATLNGTLNITRGPGFTPATGDGFQIITYSSHTNTFAIANGLILGGGLVLNPNYNATDFTLVIGTSGLSLTSLSPTSTFAGAPAFTLTVNGAGFVAGAQVLWNGSPRTTAFVSANQLTASISANDVQSPASIPVAVVLPGGLTSAARAFNVKANTMATTSQITSSSPYINSAFHSVYGEPISLTVTVNPAVPGGPDPTGTVTFYEVLGTGSSATRQPVGAATLAASSTTFTFTTDKLSVATHSIGATYSGDGNYSASIAQPIVQDVGKASTIVTITPSVPSAYFGQQVSFVAHVAPVSPGAGAPSGTVTFVFHNQTLPGCSNLVIMWDPVCAVPALPEGIDVISANYYGDQNFEFSFGNISYVVQHFNPAYISGNVYFDRNHNGIQDTGEGSRGGVTLELTNPAGTKKQIQTDSSGQYKFGNLSWGHYEVRMIPSPSNIATTKNPVYVDTMSGVGTIIWFGEAPAADVKVVKTSTSATATRGGSITYKIKVTNMGPGQFGGGAMSDTLPSTGYLTFSSLTSPLGWWCTKPLVGYTGTVKCNLPWPPLFFSPNTSATFTLVVNVKSTTPLTVKSVSNTAKFGGQALYDPVGTNNLSSVSVTLP